MNLFSCNYFVIRATPYKRPEQSTHREKKRLCWRWMKKKKKKKKLFTARPKSSQGHNRRWWEISDIGPWPKRCPVVKGGNEAAGASRSVENFSIRRFTTLPPGLLFSRSIPVFFFAPLLGLSPLLRRSPRSVKLVHESITRNGNTKKNKKQNK